MSRKGIDLIVVTGLASVAAITTCWEPVALLRPLLSIPLVFVLPGYAATAFLLAGCWLSTLERCALTLGTSLAIGAVGGLILHLTPWGLRPESWVILLSGLTILFSGLAFLHRHSRPPGQGRQSPAVDLAPQQAFLLVLAGALAIWAATVAVSGAESQMSAGFTQLWAVQSQAKESSVLIVGIRNSEHRLMRYVVRASAAGQTISQWETGELLPDHTWETRLDISSRSPGRIDVVLYAAEDLSIPYRKVSLW